MSTSFRSIAVKATIAAGLSAAASVALATTIAPLFGASVNGFGLLMCIACPLAIAWPASAWQFHNAARLRRARDDVAAMHRALDLAHRKLAAVHAELAERARRDAMTGALNREGFFAAASEVRRLVKGGSLLIVDVDHFKIINDTFGHPAGDEALRRISEAIFAELRAGDLVGRIGGEEFAIFLPGADPVAARPIAERMRTAVTNLGLRADNGRPIPVTVSIGGTADRGGVFPDLVKAADRRLYQAKKLGRNKVVFDVEVETAA